ncbi:MAG TPA: polysaccharide biosynthesis tyrosine autokinase [Fervidobacterium sp.]|nr:polysaccharide biosynthesis tyrosine autokinase [Fervidobacterium sp.]
MDQESTKDELTLEDIFRIFRKRFWWFFLILVATVLITLIYLFLATPIYEANVTLKISSQSKGSLTDIFTSQYSSSNPDISTEIELITSRTNIEKVVQNLNLVNYFQQKNSDEELDFYSVVGSVSKMITVSPVKDTKIVKISVQNSDPELARDVANELSTVYDELLRSLSKNEYTIKRQFIEQQIPTVEQDLKTLEDSLRKFKEENKVYVLDVEAQNLLNIFYNFDSQINQYKIHLDEANAKITALNQQLKQTNQKLISSETISINPVVSQLRSKLVDLQIQLAALLNTYSQDDVRVKDIKRQIDETEKMLRDEVERIVTAQVQTINPDYQRIYSELVDLHSQIEVLNSTISSTEKIREQYSDKVSKLPAVEQQLLQLERDVKVKEDLYSLLLQNLEETKISEAGVVGSAVIVDKAITPIKPVKPNKKLTLAIGAVLGFFLGILAVFVRESFDRTINDEEFVRHVLKGEPVLGRVPEMEFSEESEHPELVVAHSPTSPFSEALKLAATNIEYSDTPAPKVVAFTSSGPNEGKTVVSVNIALSYAQNGYKTLLLDLDMRRPGVEKVLGVERSNIGIVNHLLKDVPLDQITQNYLENFDIIPVGPVPPNPTALLTSKKLEEAMNVLRNEYDRIVIDLPPILAAADALIISKYTDGVVIVVRSGRTQKASFRIAYDNIKTSGLKLLGALINGISSKYSSYYYYYYYYYYTEEGKKKKRRRRASENSGNRSSVRHSRNTKRR